MKTIFHLRNAALAVLLLAGGLLLGIRFYENAVLFGGDIPTVTQVIFPILWPPIAVGGVLTVLFSGMLWICRLWTARERRRAEK